jgi:hypothetical protein
VGALVAALVLAASASPALAVPARFWGVVPQAPPTIEQLRELKEGGVDSIRIPIGWSTVQPVRGGPIDWSGTDTMVERSVSAGIEVLPFLSGAPGWAVGVDHRYQSPLTLPVRSRLQRSGWKNFVRQAVLRYGPNGSFWLENPGLPKRPIRTWQIWNEENFMYFVARPNPAEYGKLVKLTSTALKGADHGARLILGGLFSRPKQAQFRRRPPLAYFASDFLSKLYRQTPGIRSRFQGIALHPYTATYTRLNGYIEEVRRVLKANHDAGKGLWITELGWSSQPKTHGNSFAKGPSGQAQQLRGAFRLLSRNQRRWHVQRVYWFSIDDYGGTCNFCDGSGLFGSGFIPKPAWRAYVQFAGGHG